MCTSANFLIYSLKYKARVIVEGVCCSSSCGFPNIAKEEEVQDESNLRRVVRTVKVVELIIDRLNNKIVATSAHNSKPTYFLSSSCDSIK